jgi:glutamate/tyrosine decarboxylase-like PLP-dependent enzyme
MSQRARGVETWAMLAANGRRGLAELIERSCRLAERLADRLAEQGVQIVAPVVLNQALAHFDDDAVTDEVIDAVQRDGTCWAGATTWQGRRAMRLSVSDASSDEHDIDTSAAAIVDCWHAVRRRSSASSQPSKPATTPPS